MNEKINAYLNELPEELREKAKTIKTQEELMEFLSDNDVELPEDALDAVAGGCGGDDEKQIYPNACPDCGGDLNGYEIDEIDRQPVTRARCPKSNKAYYYRHNDFYRTWYPIG